MHTQNIDAGLLIDAFDKRRGLFLQYHPKCSKVKGLLSEVAEDVRANGHLAIMMLRSLQRA